MRRRVSALYTCGTAKTGLESAALKLDGSIKTLAFTQDGQFLVIVADHWTHDPDRFFPEAGIGPGPYLEGIDTFLVRLQNPIDACMVLAEGDAGQRPVFTVNEASLPWRAISSNGSLDITVKTSQKIIARLPIATTQVASSPLAGTWAVVSGSQLYLFKLEDTMPAQRKSAEEMQSQNG